MSILHRIIEARRRRRTHSKFDTPARSLARRLEQRIKFLLSNPLGAVLRPKRVKLPLTLSQISSVLIFRYDAIGDLVLSTSLWRILKKRSPNIRIGLAASEKNRILAENDPDVDDVYILSRGFSLTVLRELFRARRRKWDLVLNISFHDKTRGAIYAKIIAPNAPCVTIAREKKEKYERLYSHVGDRPPIPTPMVLQNLLVMEEAIDLQISKGERIPTLKLPAKIDAEFSPTITAINGSDRPYVLLNLDASQLYNEWGLENSLALSKRIVDQLSLNVLWTCSPQHREAAEQALKVGLSTGIRYLPTPSILHLEVAVKHARAIVTPDTSVIHIATALEVPLVGLFVMENEFMPFGGISRVVFSKDERTVRSISVDDAFDALKELLAATETRAASA
jgi:ADP-heptose:LPS heptosyltransferase